MVVLGIDIGGTQIKAGMVDEKGAILASRTIPTPADIDDFVPSLHSAIAWLIEATSAPEGVGVGCKGIINPDTTQVEILPGTLHFLEGLHLSDLVGLPANTPVFADNDARVALAGEVVWGAARDRLNVLMLTLGMGVGGAVLANGIVLRGHSGVAGHLGHMTIDPDGGLCACGNRGCLETVFSARAIEGEAWAAVHRGCSSTLTRLFRDHPQLATCRTIFQAAREGDDLCRTIVTKAIGKLAGAIAGLLHVFDPEIVILGGHVADAGADLMVPLQEEVWQRSRKLLGRDVPLVEQQVADNSGIVGAAGLVMVPRS
ncbi:MAG TPA: ROK family protein [Candidatus Sulfopaludibacter sp.]|jgi:glucokinase|nr:ROK family protein [Candidatus Sulfopaludibacter sp.]